jgi:fumarate hydratase class II
MEVTQYRLVQDSMGEVKVPTDALYGAQTQRAIDNFPISGLTLPARFITAGIMIKRAAAEVNRDLKLLSTEQAAAIMAAADTLLKALPMDQFPIDVFQTGSATSSNMNINEVIANLAQREGVQVNPNDHVNLCQSSNDVIPSMIHLSAALALKQQLLPSLDKLAGTLLHRAASLDAICKTGRTHLMDAMPIRMSQEITAWANQIRECIARIKDSEIRLHQVVLGGTAVGTGINAHPEFATKVVKRLSEQTGLALTLPNGMIRDLSNQNTAVELSGQLRVVALCLHKIANDLRWMNSGPLAGLGEITLTALQPGSSIMPGKVNPVIPEAIMMVAAQVIGNDATISMAGQSSNFQLNTMLPLIAYNLLQSIELLTNGSTLLAEKALADFKVNQEKIQHTLSLNPVLVTALNPLVGYQKAAEISKQAYEEGKSLIDVAHKHTSLTRRELEKLLDPFRLTQGGIYSDHSEKD